jgi:GT2 family glycosyltransferase
MKASIIIVTRNRAEDLRGTLASLKRMAVPEGQSAELLVIDNGSTDETEAVAKSADLGRVALRYISESRQGKSSGLNRGIAASSGDVLLFTDDDVRVPANWLHGMCEPIATGKAMVVAGGVKLAPHLLRSWMTPVHRSWLASTEWIADGAVTSLVGANMAIAREVFRQVPGFDPELGPGGTGFSDDHLLALQIMEAGFTIHDRTSVSVEHHCDPSRLCRASWLSAAVRRGISQAYVGHHWEHWACRFGWAKEMKAGAQLAAWRAANREWMTSEGCAAAELELVFGLSLVRAHVSESKRPRNYERHGLVKLNDKRSLHEVC